MWPWVQKYRYPTCVFCWLLLVKQGLKPVHILDGLTRPPEILPTKQGRAAGLRHGELLLLAQELRETALEAQDGQGVLHRPRGFPHRCVTRRRFLSSFFLLLSGSGTPQVAAASFLVSVF